MLVLLKYHVNENDTTCFSFLLFEVTGTDIRNRAHLIKLKEYLRLN